MDVCRVCLSNLNKFQITIFDKVAGESISKIIGLCSGIQIQENDKLTKNVCHVCLGRLENFVSLRKDCINSQMELRLCSSDKKFDNVSIEVEKEHESSSDNKLDNISIEVEKELESISSDNKLDNLFENEEIKIEIVELIEVADCLQKEPEEKEDDYDDDEEFVAKSKKRKRSSRKVTEKVVTSTSSRRKLSARDLGCKQPSFEYEPDESGAVKCCGCDTIAQTYEELLSHTRMLHEPQNSYQTNKNECSFCFELLNEAQTIVDHIKVNYVCDMCTATYPTLAAYDEHLNVFHLEMDFKCCGIGCEFRCDTLEELKEHTNELHSAFRDRSRGKGIECDICFKKLKVGTPLEGHKMNAYVKAIEGDIKKKNKEILRCCGRHCNSQFETTEKLNEHIKEVHLPNRILDDDPAAKELSFECKGCFARFRTSENRKRHNTRVFSKKIFKCHICTASRRTQEELTEHETTHKDLVFKCCSQKCKFTSKTREELEAHGKEIHVKQKDMFFFQNDGKQDRAFKCDICCKSYSTNKELSVHKRLPYAEKKYVCDLCGASFVAANILEKHKEVHSVEQHPCMYCGKIFKTQNLRKIHYITHEDVEKKFICQICKKAYRNRRLLISHLTSHSSDRDFKCTACPQTFKRQHHLLSHVKRIHIQEQHFQCDYCEKRFFDKNHKKCHEENVHLKIPNFTCRFCHKTYAVRNDYMTHVENHLPNDQKEFGCPKCEKRFTEKQFLDSHFQVNHLEIGGTLTEVMQMRGAEEGGSDYNTDDLIEEENDVDI